MNVVHDFLKAHLYHRAENLCLIQSTVNKKYFSAAELELENYDFPRLSIQKICILTFFFFFKCTL